MPSAAGILLTPIPIPFFGMVQSEICSLRNPQPSGEVLKHKTDHVYAL